MRLGIPVLALVVVLGCRAVPERRLVVAVPAGPSSLLPNNLNEELTLSVQSNVFETLVGVDAGLAVGAGLAESWHSPDDLTWVFRLRRGVPLHNGGRLTASDVVRALEHARDDPTSRRRSQLELVTSLEAPDDRTIVVRTRAPFDPLPARLANVHIWARGAGGAPVATGRYRVRSWSEGGTTVLEAFPDHPDGLPDFTVVEFRVAKQAAERARLLREGKVDLVVDAPADEMKSLPETPGVRVVTEMGLRVLFLGMDSAHARSPHFPEGNNAFRDVRVRRAVALAVDRNALVRGPLGGFAEVVDAIVSPQELGGHKDALEPRRYDPTEARRLLAEAGFGNGFAVHLDYIPEKYRAMEAVATSIARDLAAVGIRALLRPGSPREVVTRVERQDTALYVLGWISDTGDGRVSYEYLLHTPTRGFGIDNGGGYSNPEVDRLIEEASGRMLPEQRDAILSRLGRLVHEDVPVVPLYRQADLYALRSDLVFRPRLDRRVKAAEIRKAR